MTETFRGPKGYVGRRQIVYKFEYLLTHAPCFAQMFDIESQLS